MGLSRSSKGLQWLPFSSLAPLDLATARPPLSMAVSLLLRVLPLLRHRLQQHHHRIAAAAASASAAFSSGSISPPSLRWPLCTAAGDSVAPEETAAASAVVKESEKYQRWNDPELKQWKEKEEEILKDIEPILLLAKDIIHSRTYMDGEHLKAEDEKAIVDKLLAYHPNADDKVGCGLDSIMVDRHPQYRQSRCLFLIRTDGAWVDFSYQKCLKQYIREKYPSLAERFIREHFKRSRD